MNDLISRQATIEAIKGFKQAAAEWRDEQEEQEERSDIWHRADSAIASALEIGLRVKKLPSAQRWIPCSERLPEENTIVLATTADSMYIVEFEVYSNGHMHWNEVNEYRSIADVIAWMPLPEPYKEGEGK